MVTRTDGKRQRLDFPAGTDKQGDELALAIERYLRSRAAERPPTAPPPPAPPAGPSWREFLFAQVTVIAVATLLFGSIAYAFVSRVGAGNDQTAATTMPMDGTPAAMPLHDPAHGGAPAPAAAGLPRLPQPAVAPPVGQRPPMTVKVDLETKEIVATMDDGVTYEYWTFGGTVPGPMIRVRQGDTVELTLRNAPDSKVMHNIDLHAVTGPGGGGEATMVQPGEAKTFRFQAMNPGVYVYHCATAPVPHHIASGMYGLIVIEPPQGLPPVDREFYVMQGDFYLQGERGSKGLRAYANDKMLAEQPDYVVFNGSVGALTGDNALKARVGETVRLFFGVGGPNLTSSFHVIGEIFDRVSLEGGSFEDPAKWLTNVQSTGVPTGGATVVEFTLDVPGKFVLVDHSLGRTLKGGAAILQVDGPENPAIFEPVR